MQDELDVFFQRRWRFGLELMSMNLEVREIAIEKIKNSQQDTYYA
jgi:hypothetical protein